MRLVVISPIFDAQGVKANVLFFDRKPASEKPWTEKLWIYDLRTNQHFTLKEKTLKRSDPDEFVKCFHPENRHERTESERFKCFPYDELLKRDKVNLDNFWLKDESLEDSAIFLIPTCSRWRSLQNWKQLWSSLRSAASRLCAARRPKLNGGRWQTPSSGDYR